MRSATELRVCMDIGCERHHVGIGLSTGEMLEDVPLNHKPQDIQVL